MAIFNSVVENGKLFIQQKLFFAVKMSDRDNKIVMCKYLQKRFKRERFEFGKIFSETKEKWKAYYYVKSIYCLLKIYLWISQTAVLDKQWCYISFI